MSLPLPRPLPIAMAEERTPLKSAQISRPTPPPGPLPEASERGSALKVDDFLLILVLVCAHTINFIIESPFPKALGKGRGWGRKPVRSSGRGDSGFSCCSFRTIFCVTGMTNWLPSRWRICRLLDSIVVLLLLIAAISVKAQDGGATDNDVIRVAERMYCPVCENIPLDDCETIACVEWKEEIRAQLAAGRSDQQVINSFVARFGDNVVGVPQDPLLRALTVIMPLLATALALGLGVFTFRRFGAQRKLGLPPPPGSQNEGGGATGDSARELTEEAYRQRLETDVRGRR